VAQRKDALRVYGSSTGRLAAALHAVRAALDRLLPARLFQLGISLSDLDLHPFNAEQPGRGARELLP